MPKIMLEGQFGPTTEKKYQRVLSAARALRPDTEPLTLPSPEMPSGETVATRDALEKVLRQRLDSLNLPDIDAKITNLIRNVERDADGNIYLRGVAEGADLTTEGGYSTNDQRVIQVALDAIMAKADKPQDVEAAVVDVLNHEVLHALRQLDLITESELKMLEKLATKYKKSGTEQTYEQWAIENYPELRNRPTSLIEEAVAKRVDIKTAIGLVEKHQVRLQQRHLQHLVTFLLAAREADIDGALQHVVLDLELLRLLAHQLEEFHGVHFRFAAKLALRVIGCLQEGGRGNARDFHRILKGEENATASPLIGGEFQKIFTLIEDFARSHFIAVPPGQYVRERALAGAVRPHDRMNLALIDGEIDAFQDFLAPDGGV